MTAPSGWKTCRFRAAAVPRSWCAVSTGRRTVSFFSSSNLLKKGMADCALAPGHAREGFGFESSSYGEAGIFTGSLRYGLTGKITVDAPYSATDRLHLAGAGVTAVPLAQDVVSLSISGTRAQRRFGLSYISTERENSRDALASISFGSSLGGGRGAFSINGS